jgi:Flp pilus assembly protein TadB
MTVTEINHDEIEEVAALGPGILARGAEVAVAVLIGLLVCPPLAILTVVVAVPLLAVAIVVGLVAAIVAMPYLLVRRVRAHHRTHASSVLAHGLRRLRVREA